MIAIGEEKCAAQTYIGDDRGESGLTIALTMISPCRWNAKKSSYRFTMPPTKIHRATAYHQSRSFIYTSIHLTKTPKKWTKKKTS